MPPTFADCPETPARKSRGREGTKAILSFIPTSSCPSAESACHRPKRILDLVAHGITSVRFQQMSRARVAAGWHAPTYA